MKRRNVITVKARIRAHPTHDTVVPVVIPELDDVRRFAGELHTQGRPWSGEAFGWPAEYEPEQAAPPLDSKLAFTPADFCIGESGVWFFSMTWEKGKESEPSEFLDDKNILSANPSDGGRPNE